MQIQLLYFAPFRKLVGAKEERITLPDGTTVSDLKLHLVEMHASLEEGLETAVIAINRDFAFPEDVLQEGDEVAIFPPISGGSVPLPTIVWITEEELDMNDVLESIILPTTVAACVFTGVVKRQKSSGDAHEGYQSVTEERVLRIAEEIRAKWSSIEGIAIVQRAGELHPGTPVALVACSAARRDEGVFQAAQYGIDRIKEITPISIV
jgi:molybdopterin converting factor subunit 1